MFYGLNNRQKTALYLLAFLGLFFCGYVGSWYLNQPAPMVFEQKKLFRHVSQEIRGPQKQTKAPEVPMKTDEESAETDQPEGYNLQENNPSIDPVNNNNLVSEQLQNSISPQSHKINLNQASEKELHSLPGIGPSTATLIIEYRNAHGGFHSIDELRVVKGIGPKKFAKIQSLLTLDNEG